MRLGLAILLILFAQSAQASLHGMRWEDPNPEPLEIQFQVLPEGTDDWWVTLPATVADDRRLAVIFWPEAYGTVLVRARLRDASQPEDFQWSDWSSVRQRPADGERTRPVPEPGLLMGLTAGVGLMRVLHPRRETFRH